MRLDKYISQTTELSRKEVKRLLKYGLVTLDSIIIKNAAQQVTESNQVHLDGQLLSAPGPRYFMMHKPQGFVSVTKDATHPTVLELMDEANKDRLQIAGRLDIDTTGLLLITDDGQWNHAITAPNKDCEKVYYATLAHDISDSTAEKFSNGILLDGETHKTRPATLEIVYSNEARLTIMEGRYHQVKRMFAAVGNRVTELHREQVGNITLDTQLQPGEYRALSETEIQSVTTND